MTTQRHWTSESAAALAYAVAADLTGLIEQRADQLKIGLHIMALALNKTEQYVLNLIQRPNDPTFRELVSLAKSVGFKVALVAYDEDKAGDDTVSPVNGKIFEQCWRVCGSPRDFFDLEEVINRRRKDDEKDG